MPLMTGGKAVVESLKAHGVDTIFGIISTHTMYMYDALYHEQDSIRFIGGRHEHALGFMADGYSRVTGKPGVLFTSGGPGAADSMGSMGEAYHASSMVLQVTANCELELIDSGKGAIHEAKDQLGMFRSVTGWNALIDNLDSLPDYFLEAFQRFSSGRPRPVELEVPTDLFEKQTDIEVLPPRETASLQPDPSKIEQAAQALKKAKRPVIWVGRGVMLANATAELRQLAETLQAPVTGATTGKGAFPDDHPLGLGVGEFGGIRGESPLGDFLNRSDLILLVGSSMAYHRTVQQGLKLPPNIIQIDIDPGEIGKNYPVSLGIVGDARMALEQMLSLIDANQVQPDPGYAKEISLLKDDIYQSLVTQYPNELRTLEGIRSVLARDAVVVGDATVPNYRASRCMPFYEPNTYIGPNSWAGLGFGFPAGLGAKVGVPDRQVVVITGDGGFQYNIQELGTALQYGISPVVLVFNDNAWGVLKGVQRETFNGRYMGTELRNPDFVKLAEAYGAAATRVHNLDQLTTALGSALEGDVVHLIVVEMPEDFASFR